MKELQIEWLPLSALIPYENNPRKNDDAVEFVANSIRDFGFRVPIIIDDTNTIVAGHTRYKAAELLGIDKVPVIRKSDWSSEQIQSYRLVDNKTQELSKWDYGKLADEMAAVNTDPIDGELEDGLEGLEFPEIDMSRYGFNDPDELVEHGRQDFTEGDEISLDDFEDQNFDLECPICGFRFNEDGGGE